MILFAHATFQCLQLHCTYCTINQQMRMVKSGIELVMSVLVSVLKESLSTLACVIILAVS